MKSMRIKLIWFVVVVVFVGFQQSFQNLINVEKVAEMNPVMEALREVATIFDPSKSSVWFVPNQTDSVSILLEKLNVPVILNAAERSRNEGMETRFPSELVIVLNDLSIDRVLDNTLWKADTRFLVSAADFDKMRSNFKSFWKRKIVNVLQAIDVDADVSIYGYVPYAEGNCGSDEPVLLDKYLPERGEFRDGGSKLIESGRIKNANGCPVNVTIVKVKPFTIFEDDCDCNKSSHLDGIEGKLMTEAAKKFNFNASFVTALDGIRWGWIRPEPRGAVGELFTGRSDFAVGLLAPTIERYENLDISFPYDGEECITYGVPKGAGVSTPYWITILVFEFTPLTWLLILFSFAFMFYVFYGLNEYYGSKWFRRHSDVFLYQFSSFLGFPIDIPHYFAVRLIIILWILWSFIITVAYRSSISSKLTVPTEDPDINTFEELIRSPLELSGYHNMLRLLEYDDSESAIRKMVTRFKVTDFDINYAVDVIAKERKMAYARHTSTFLYYSLINPTAKGNIHVMTDCILSYYPSVMTKKNSPFSHGLNDLISRLKESGITKNWRSEYIYHVPPAPKPFLKLSNYHMYGVFCILCAGYALSCFVFALEIALFQWRKSRNKFTVANATIRGNLSRHFSFTR